MCFDTEGNIVATAGNYQSGPGPMIYVFAPSGRLLETQPMPVDQPTNCAFGDADLSTLYVTTAQGHLLRARNTGRRGLAAMAPVKIVPGSVELSPLPASDQEVAGYILYCFRSWRAMTRRWISLVPSPMIMRGASR